MARRVWCERFVPDCERHHLEILAKPLMRDSGSMHRIVPGSNIRVHDAGSPQALHILNNAFWKDCPGADVVSPALKTTVPVLEVEHEFRCPPPMHLQDPGYAFDALSSRAGHDFTRVSTSVIVAARAGPRSPNAFRIVCVFVTSDTDPGVLVASHLVPENVRMMEKYYPVKEHIKFYKGMRPEGDWEARAAYLKRPAYAGKNFFDGISFFAGRNGSGMEIFYTKRRSEAGSDDTFLRNHAMTYSGIYALERKHTPCMARNRQSLAEVTHSPGAIPGLPPRLLPANAVASSIGFACDVHNDSGRKGFAESILWNSEDGSPPAEGRYGFVALGANILFDLQCAPGCYMVMPGTTPHGSVLSGGKAPEDAREAVRLRHELTGCVIMTKKQTSSNTERMNDALSRLTQSIRDGRCGDARFGGIQV